MEEEYGQITSYYYQKYRPPLHQIILEKCLSSNRNFKLGLDIGCGTGHSSIALSQYCTKVIGVEPSAHMLNNAHLHPKVEYQLLATESLTFDDQIFDIATFAGSLYYAKSQKILDELVRVCKNNAQIIVYDFRIELDLALQYLIGESNLGHENEYNHEEDFSGLNVKKIIKKNVHKENIEIEILNHHFAQLLLSSKDNYKALLEVFGSQYLEQKISSKLQGSTIQFGKNAEAILYYTIYVINK